MQEMLVKNMVSVRYGILLAVITLLYGFGLGGAFGVFEGNIKGHLEAQAKQVFEAKYKGDEAKLKKITDKSWSYFKRAHLHASGLGVIALSLILTLMFLSVDNNVKSITALCLGLGSLGYSVFWMFAGLKAPGMGSTGMAKESLKWIAIPSAGLCIIGLAIVLVLLVITLFVKGDKRNYQ
jgi:hypothetical protein